jgi:hypothetical protein
MKSLSALAVSFSLVLSGAVASAVVYGPVDHRQDVKDAPQYRELAKAVAISVGTNLLTLNSDGTYSIQMVTSLAKSAEYDVCPGERFASQPSLGIYTGFLIGDRYLITAGHGPVAEGIIDNETQNFCAQHSWYFDYTLDSAGNINTQQISSSQIYHCKRIIHAENIELPAPTNEPGLNPGNDFAIIELDRPVAGAKPLPIAPRPINIGEMVFTIGHPSGLPAKFSGFSWVRSNPTSFYYSVNLDTQEGNSGSPVFNMNNQVTGILVSGHPVDYYNTRAGCYRLNYCDQNGLNCNLNAERSYAPTSNFVQRIETLFPYLKKL